MHCYYVICSYFCSSFIFFFFFFCLVFCFFFFFFFSSRRRHTRCGRDWSSDVCSSDLKLPVVFCLDRSGLVGEDGATHHGIFDLAYLRAIPHLTIFAPRDEIQLRQMLYTAQLGLKQPLAIRYPRGYGRLEHWKVPFQPISLGIGEVLVEGTKIAVITI